MILGPPGDIHRMAFFSTEEFPTARPHPALSVHPSPQVGCATPKPRHQNRGQLALWNRKDMEGYLVGGLNQPI